MLSHLNPFTWNLFWYMYEARIWYFEIWGLRLTMTVANYLEKRIILFPSDLCYVLDYVKFIYTYIFHTDILLDYLFYLLSYLKVKYFPNGNISGLWTAAVLREMI
jgi:hypothetical protein